MPNITALPVADPLSGGEVLPLVQAGVAKSVVVATLTTELASEAQAAADDAAASATASADSATASASSATDSMTQADLAADSATDAANSAFDAAVSSAKTFFTSTTTGLAGTVSGQYFNVQQAVGEGGDTYLNSAGTAVWQAAGAVGDLQISKFVERYYPYAVTPYLQMFSQHTLVQNGRGSNNAARPIAKVFGRNLYPYVHGVRNSGSGPTVTQKFANGPTKTNTATRVVFTVNTQLFSVWSSGYRPPAGTYTVDFQIKSNSGADTAIRTGNTAQGFTARTALTASWTRVQHQITSDGTTWASFSITGDGANLPDLLIDEMRIYPTVSTEVPLYSAEVLGDDFQPTLAFPNTRHTGRLLSNTTSAVEGSGVLRVGSYPTTKTFTECTLMACAAMDTAQSNQQLLTTDFDSSLSTTNATLAITSTSADGSPDFTGITSLFAYRMDGAGVLPLTLAVKNGDRRAYLDNIEIGSATSAFTGFSSLFFRVGANAASEATAYQNTFRWNGRIGSAAVYDRYLTSDQVTAEVEKSKNTLRSAGITIGDIPAFLIAMGDSQTASFTGARGPSWAVLQADVAAHTPNMPMRNLAVGGSTTQDVITNQLPTALEMIDQITATSGRSAVVALFVGTNDQAAIVTDWNNGVSPFTSPTGWWATTKANLFDVLRARGARVVIATPLPDNASPPANWDTARLALRDVMLAQTTYFVMDFGGTAGLSTVADTASGNFDTDHRHVSTAGHLLLKPVAVTAIAAAARAVEP